jgi:hypothetical protein
MQSLKALSLEQVEQDVGRGSLGLGWPGNFNLETLLHGRSVWICLREQKGGGHGGRGAGGMMVEGREVATWDQFPSNINMCTDHARADARGNRHSKKKNRADFLFSYLDRGLTNYVIIPTHHIW